MLLLLLACNQVETTVEVPQSTETVMNPFQSEEFEACLVENLPTGMDRLIQLRDGVPPDPTEITILEQCLNTGSAAGSMVSGESSGNPRKANWEGPNPFQEQVIETCLLEMLPGGMQRLTQLREGAWVEQIEIDILNTCMAEQSPSASAGGGKIVWTGGNPFLDQALEACLLEGLSGGPERLAELRNNILPTDDEFDVLNSCTALAARQSGQSNWSDTNPFSDPNITTCLLDAIPGGANRLEELQGNARPTSAEIQALNDCIASSLGATVGIGGSGSGGAGGTSGPTAEVKINSGIPVSTSQLTLEPPKAVVSRVNFPTASLAALCEGNPQSALMHDANDTFYRLLRSREVWDVGCTGKGSVIVIIDSTDSAHPAYADQVILELCIASEQAIATCDNGEKYEEGPGAASGDSAHGTSVTGAVNHFAPEAQLILIKPAGSTGSSVGDTKGAYEWVVSNATKYKIDAAVMSFGSGQSERELYRAGLDDKCPNDHPLSSTFAQMKTLGVMPIFASGNDGQLSMLGFPACLNSTVSVGATDEFGNVATYSNSHQDLTLLAPAGFRIPVGYDGGYGTPEGTSFAAPAYAALVAIGRQIRADITVDELIQASRHASRRIDDVQVSDLRLIDFLGFAQHLTGQPIPFRQSNLISIDATYDIYGGQTLVAYRLERELMGVPFDTRTVTALDVIASFGPQCRISEGRVTSRAPGECVIKITSQPLTDDGRDTGVPATKLIRLRSREVRPSDIQGEIHLQKQQSVQIADITRQFSMNFAGSWFTDVNILSGGNEVCSYSERQLKLVTLGSGNCNVLIKHTPTDSNIRSKTIIVTIKVN